METLFIALRAVGYVAAFIFLFGWLALAFIKVHLRSCGLAGVTSPASNR